MDTFVSLRSSVVGRQEQHETEDEQSIVQQAISTALTPVKIATSRPAIKLYLSTILFFATSIILLSVSTSAYALFYYRYIPQIDLERVVYFQYGAGTHPHATIPLQTTGLISQQPYDIDVVLRVPRTPSNLAAGNFMVDLSLLTTSLTAASLTPSSTPLPETMIPSGYTTIGRSRRPAILPYSSLITSLSHKILHLPGHLLSLRDVDSSTLKVPMFEHAEFSRGKANIPTHVYIELQSQSSLSAENCPSSSGTTSPILSLIPFQPAPQGASSIQIYTAKIIFSARFEGLRYIIYNYRIVSFLTFSALFYMFAMISMATAWATISTLFTPVKQNSDLTRYKPIKSEENSTAAASDASVTKSRQGKIKDEASSSATAEKKSLYDIKAEVDEAATPDTSDAEHEARTGGLITDQHLDAEDEEEEEDDEENLSRPDVIRSSSGLSVKKEEGEGDDDQAGRFADSGLGTSMESEVAASGSGLVRRRSAKDSSRAGRRDSSNR